MTKVMWTIFILLLIGPGRGGELVAGDAQGVDRQFAFRRSNEVAWTNAIFQSLTFSEALRRDEVAAVLEFVRRECANNRSVVLSATGLPVEKAELFAHNVLWASALSGLTGVTLRTTKRTNFDYEPLAKFLEDIPFATAGLEPILQTTAGEACRVVGLRGKRHAFLWISSEGNTWQRRVVEGKSAPRVTSASFALDGLVPGSFTLQWWDTRTGKMIRETSFLTDLDKFPTIATPEFESDIACKILPR